LENLPYTQMKSDPVNEEIGCFGLSLWQSATIVEIARWPTGNFNHENKGIRVQTHPTSE